jgi:hypothetical protein
MRFPEFKAIGAGAKGRGRLAVCSARNRHSLALKVISAPAALT